MAVTATLVAQGHDWLTYQVVYDGVVGTGSSVAWTSTGAASPDLQTDSLAGPLKNLSKAKANGYGNIAAGALNQAQSRALWLSILSSVNPGSPTLKQIGLPTARWFSTKQAGGSGAGTAPSQIVIDADVDGSGNPVIRAAVSGNTDQSGTWLVDIQIPGTIGA